MIRHETKRGVRCITPMMPCCASVKPAACRRSVMPQPMQPDNRSLNLSNGVAVIAYEAWRQLGFVTSA